jgi:predicted transcriptional regulator
MSRITREVSKSQSIREFLTENPTAKAKEVVSALAEKRVTVNEGLVYAVKGGMAERKKRKKRVAKAAMAAHSPETPAVKADALTMIRETKALAAKAGGFKRLMELVAALAE